MRGFLKAAFDDPVPQLQDRAAGLVSLHLPVREGLQYRLAAVQWSGNMVFSSDELNHGLKVPLGKSANQVQLEQDLTGISKIYGTRGYMEARQTPKYEFDDGKQEVMAVVEVQEGNQYHFGSVGFVGLTTNAEEALRKTWKLKAGDVYDTSYPGLFLVGAGRQFDLSQLQVSMEQRAHPDTKTVDLEFRFRRKSP